MADDIATQNRERAELEQLENMREAARQEGARQARDNAAAERLRTFGDEPPKGKRAAEEFLRGEETISGPTGPTSSVFSGQTLRELARPPEGDSDAGSSENH